MLVLSRKEGERIILGNGVVVTVLRTQNGRVRLGVDAPKGVRIMRGELCDGLSDSPTPGQGPCADLHPHPSIA